MHFKIFNCKNILLTVGFFMSIIFDLKSQNYVRALLIHEDGLVARTSLSKEDCLKLREIAAIWIMKETVTPSPILHYELMLIDGKDTTSLYGVGGKITKVMKEKISISKPNTRIVFQGIVAINEESSTRIVPYFEIRME